LTLYTNHKSQNHNIERLVQYQQRIQNCSSIDKQTNKIIMVVYDITISSEDEDEDEDDFDSSSDDTDDAAEKYGYGDAAPDTENNNMAFPKRFSTRENSIPRRRNSTSTIMCHPNSFSFSSSEHHGNYVDYETLMFDPQRVQRRSSIEGSSCPPRTRATRRRASIAACTTTTTTTVPVGRRESFHRRRSSLKSLASVTMLALVALPQCATAAPLLRSPRTSSPTTMEPSSAPSEVPTFADTDFPTRRSPSDRNVPTKRPVVRTAEPTTIEPSTTPTFAPTVADTEFPTESPTFHPTFTPTVYPSEVPSPQPITRTAEPTTMEPSNAPSEVPTFADTDFPTPRRPRTTPTISATAEIVVCVDSNELKYRNKMKKDCEWVGMKKVKKRCKKKWGNKGKKLYDACPLTCLPKGLGSCVDL